MNQTKELVSVDHILLIGNLSIGVNSNSKSIEIKDANCTAVCIFKELFKSSALIFILVVVLVVVVFIRDFLSEIFETFLTNEVSQGYKLSRVYRLTHLILTSLGLQVTKYNK